MKSSIALFNKKEKLQISLKILWIFKSNFFEVETFPIGPWYL
jgi:hypothetical protein